MSETVFLLPARIKQPCTRAEYEHARGCAERMASAMSLVIKHQDRSGFMRNMLVIIRKGIQATRWTAHHELIPQIDRLIDDALNGEYDDLNALLCQIHNRVVWLGQSQHSDWQCEREQLVEQYVDTVWRRQYRRGSFSFDYSDNPYRASWEKSKC